MTQHSTAVRRYRSSSADRRLPIVALVCSATLGGCWGEVYYPTDESAGAPSTGSAPDGAGGSAGAPGWAASGSSGSAGTPPMPEDSDCSITRLQARAILEANCASCHGPGTNVASFDSVLDVEKLVASGKVKPGNADGSPLYKRMASGQMPPASQTERPNPQEVAVIYHWIQSCTIDPPPDTGGTPECGEPRIDFPSMLSAMVADISRVELDERRFIRYFTLSHLHNSGACAAEMDTYRFALAKATNALSLGTQIVTPQAIDALETIYRIDLRDYEWDATGTREDKWERLVAANPYAVEFDEDDAQVLELFAETRVPFQTGDWFVHDGTQPPLYHDLLEIPETRQALERQLGLNIEVNVQNGDVWRAGFLNSGISAQNRVIERHELPVSNARTLWVSYDFAGDGGKENIFADPLDFEADGSELIFTLPNGLHAYMVANAAGTRLDEAPDTIVVDPRQEDNNVRNGISCMGCHEVGTKMKEDELRDYVADSSDFDSFEKRQVADLYSSKTEFESLMTRDSRLFVEAISALQLPPGGAEPIIEVFSRFDENVDLKRAAAELGVSPERLLRELGGLNPALAPLGYASVKRETFRDAFAETVCVLNLGTTASPACD